MERSTAAAPDTDRPTSTPTQAHLCQACIGRQALLDRHLPHQPQVVVKAQHLPAGRNDHEHLLARRADLFDRLWVDEAHTHCNLCVGEWRVSEGVVIVVWCG